MNGPEKAATLTLHGFAMWRPPIVPGNDNSRRIVCRPDLRAEEPMLLWYAESRTAPYRWALRFAPGSLTGIWHEVPMDVGLIAVMSAQTLALFIKSNAR